jgi:hypothetical protein
MTISVDELMTERLETIEAPSSPLRFSILCRFSILVDGDLNTDYMIHI